MSVCIHTAKDFCLRFHIIICSCFVSGGTATSFFLPFVHLSTLSLSETVTPDSFSSGRLEAATAASLLAEFAAAVDGLSLGCENW